LLESFSTKFLDGITIVSVSQLEFAKKFYGKEIELIPPGLKLEPFIKARNEPQEKYLLCVGRIIPGKGLETLIKAFDKLQKEKTDLKLYVVGDSVYASQYLKYLKKISPPGVYFLGWKYGEELTELYRNAFAVVMPSEAESFSLVLYEALFYNGMVICSDIDQFKLTVDSYVVFFSNKIIDSLYEAIISVYKDKNLVDSMRNIAKSFPFDNNDWDKIGKRFENYYNSILQ
jgi:glycosyltransferase involved in cell wall biosynthesis